MIGREKLVLKKEKVYMSKNKELRIKFTYFKDTSL